MSCNTGDLSVTQRTARLSGQVGSASARSRYLGNVVDEVLVAVLRVNLAQLCQPLQVALDLVLLPLKRQAVVHHRFDLLHLLWSLGVSDGPPLHGPLVLCFLSPRKSHADVTDRFSPSVCFTHEVVLMANQMLETRVN